MRWAITVTMRVSSVVSLLVVTCSGCASVTAPVAPPAAVKIPVAWSAPDIASAGHGSSLAEWWLRFDDPLLAQLVSKALQSNITVMSAKAALRQARALRDASQAVLFPVLNASASAQRGSAGRLSSQVVNDFSVRLDAGWELDIFGANRSALHVSDALMYVSAASLGDAQVSVAAEVAVAVLTGQPPTELSIVLADIVPVPHVDDELVLSVPAETLRNRPDVRYAEHQVSAALARVSQARAARAPDFLLGGSLSSSALTVGALGGSLSIVKSILASVSMPLFDGGARGAQVRAQCRPTSP